MATSARLDELKKKFDENPRRYFAPLANEYRKLGDLTQAIALCRTHLPNQPGHISGHIVLAQALYEARELGEARSIFEAALDLDPENLIALRYLGDIAREQGEPGMARTWYERVLEADPRNDEIAQLLQELAKVESAPTLAEPEPAPVAVGAADVAVPSFGDTEIADSTAPSFLAEPSELASVPAEPEFQATAPSEFQLNAMSGAHDAVVADTAPDGLALAHAIPALADMSDEPVAQGDVSSGSESIAEEVIAPIAPAESTEQAAVLATHDDPFFGGASPHNGLDMGDLEAIAEPTVDDWFSAPSDAGAHDVTAHAASDPAAFDDSFFPDLAAATPVATPVVPEPAALSFAPPAVVDVQAPTPPYVRAEEERAAIPTPAFLASMEEIELTQEGSPPAAPVASAQEQAPEAEAAATSFAPAPAEQDALAALEPPAFVSAYEAEYVADTTPAAPVEASGPVTLHESAEVVDWHTAPTPIDSPAIPELSIEEFPSPAPAVAETAADEVSSELSEAAPVEASSEFSDFNQWIAGQDSESPASATVSDEQAIPEVVASADEPQPELVTGAVAEFETEDEYAALASEAAAAATPADFILEDNAFVPPAADEVTYIASSISAPVDDGDAYSVGVPELSAHEPFPIEAEREPEAEAFEPALAGWGSTPLDASAEVEAPETLGEFVAPVEGLLSRETPADLAAVAAASESHDASAPEDLPPSVDAIGEEQLEIQAFADEADVSPAVAAGESPAFVTETMAELYLQQGFHEEALSIYRQLLAQQPNDPALRDRVAALERGASSAVVEGLAPRDAVDRHGQSVRAFFLHFARREPRRSSASSGEEDSESSDPAGVGEPTESRVPSFSGVATREEALTVPDAPPPTSGEATSLSDLFAAGSVSGADDRAASALASAFGSGDAGGSAPSPSGERELSLEHLFRDVPERSSGAVTLDEFYEGSSPGSSAPPSPEGEGGEERDADIEQFTAWLEGLKKK